MVLEWLLEPITPHTTKYISNRYPNDSDKAHWRRINYDPGMNEKARTNPDESFTINNLALQTQWNRPITATQAVRRLTMEKIMMRPDWEDALKEYEAHRQKYLMPGSEYMLALFNLKREVKLRYRHETTPYEFKPPQFENFYWPLPFIRPTREKTTKSFFDPPPTP
ncbi:uncharacterized protein LOC129602806 [Paramacrobiotus metropolitanus]|uniref:uncharacterized protein LOC129602806 n=1 Tax=Paramacrobiotus metropolitanus TaxID=2943436 RepID=UPI0024460DC6|nr:uncharacterized protein LOC129602806 [Paramacrobiotus metropolitanus]